MFIYNTASSVSRCNKKINAIAKSDKSASKSKKSKSGGKVKSLRKQNAKFLKSLGFKVKKIR